MQAISETSISHTTRIRALLHRGMPRAAGFTLLGLTVLGLILHVGSWFVVGQLVTIWLLVMASSATACEWPPPHGRLETDSRLLLPPLCTALLVVAVGLFAGAHLSPLEWVKLIAEREYQP